jgi:uncharacterized protein (UPF0262 family)
MENLLPIPRRRNNKPLLYKDIIDEKYHLMFLCSSTKSGKTFSLLQLLLNHYIIPFSPQKIFIVCPSTDICESWRAFLRLVPIFNEVIICEDVPDDIFKRFEKIRNKSPVSEYVEACENIIILDDVSEHTRKTAITGLTKKYRHKMKSCMFICSQSYVDLNPSAKSQLDALVLWGGIRKQYLEKMHDDLMGKFKMDFDEFESKYREMTEQPYSFIFMKLKKGEIKQGWV